MSMFNQNWTIIIIIIIIIIISIIIVIKIIIYWLYGAESSWEGHSCSAGQNDLRLCCNPKATVP
jgi:flagellar basal body-associated protein FliL